MSLGPLAILGLSLALAGATPPAKTKTKRSAKTKAVKKVVPAGPEWLAWKPGCHTDGAQRDFTAVGRSSEDGTPEVQGPQAEDDARQHLGEAIATWQERTLRCAKKASETKTKTTSADGHSLLNLSVESATEVSLYKERVEARSPDGKRSAVLMKHDLTSMLEGIANDTGRSVALREAVHQCGQQTFDELAAAK